MHVKACARARVPKCDCKIEVYSDEKPDDDRKETVVRPIVFRADHLFGTRVQMLESQFRIARHHRACVNPKRNHMHASTCPRVRALQQHANITCVPNIDFRSMCASTQHVHLVDGSPGTRTYRKGLICAHRDERSTQTPRRQNRNMHMHAARVWRMLSADALGCTVSARKLLPEPLHTCAHLSFSCAGPMCSMLARDECRRKARNDVKVYKSA